LQISGSLTQTGGTFNAGSGTVLFSAGGSGGTTHTISFTALTFNNLVFGDSGSGTDTYRIGSGTLNVQGNFTAQVGLHGDHGRERRYVRHAGRAHAGHGLSGGNTGAVVHLMLWPARRSWSAAWWLESSASSQLIFDRP
jgi:hypothetical protein